jgi:hypothetical protein
MKRSEFLRLSILSALAVPVLKAADILPKDIPVKIGTINLNGLGVKPVYKRYSVFKITTELLQDKKGFENFIKHYSSRVDGKLVNTQVGWIYDDLENNLLTVKLTFDNKQ